MRLAIITIITILLAACEGHYRYPCQNPKNWERQECHNEVCKASGKCTEQVLGKLAPPFGTDLSKIAHEKLTNPDEADDPLPPKPAPPAPAPTQKAPAEKKAISSQECVNDCAVPPVERSVLLQPAKAIESIPEEPEVIEKPVTMNTIVDTTAHNIAANKQGK